MKHNRAAEILSELADLSARTAALSTCRAELERALAEALAAELRVATVTPGTPEYLTTREAAALLGVSTRHLEAMRAEGRGPRCIRVGRAVRYPRAELGVLQGADPKTT